MSGKVRRVGQHGDVNSVLREYGEVVAEWGDNELLNVIMTWRFDDLKQIRKVVYTSSWSATIPCMLQRQRHRHHRCELLNERIFRSF